MTFPAALGCDRIDAPCVFDGPVNAISFTAYVEQFLVPTLRSSDVVIAAKDMRSVRATLERSTVLERRRRDSPGVDRVKVRERVLSPPSPIRHSPVTEVDDAGTNWSQA